MSTRARRLVWIDNAESRHVTIFDCEMRFHFRGKSGQVHDIALKDSRLAKVVRQCQCIPGYELFQYVDDTGAHSSIHSGDVNEYLREILQADFTCQGFSHWNRTCLAARFFYESGPAASPTEAKAENLKLKEATALALLREFTPKAARGLRRKRTEKK